VRMVDEEKGDFVQHAIELLLRGDLKYSRRRSNTNGNPTRVKTVRRYLPTRYKNLISKMNQTLERERVEMEMQTQLIRQHNELAENEFQKIRRWQQCGNLDSPFGRVVCDMILRAKSN